MSDRQAMEVDIACVGFGPATGGFLTTLARRLNDSTLPPLESRVVPGLPLQVVCYERADDIGFGVSGVVTRARSIRQSFPDLTPADIPMTARVTHERVVYLLDPIGASRRSLSLRLADRAVRALRFVLPFEHEAVELPYTPGFLHKRGGLVLSIGQFNQWVGQQLMLTGAVQVWPGTPVAEPLIENGRVAGVRLMDQGVDREGSPTASYLPGMDVRAELTVIGDGPFSPVARRIDEQFGTPEGYRREEWAVGMKMVIDLGGDVDLEAGTVLHTFGYPEPGIFGFFYVHPERVVSVGIFVPSWLRNSALTPYDYLQHYIQHPYLWRYLKGGRLRSWGAKSIQESGRRAEPHLAGNGYARIGEGSGSTNVLTGSGVDEAWATGVQLAEGVTQLLQVGKPFTRENLTAAYVARRRISWVEREGRIAERARDGFEWGFLTGLIGMGLAGLTRGKLAIPPKRVRRKEYSPEPSTWPPIQYDGQLLVSHQDALLIGGKVQAPAGVADHVKFVDQRLCKNCGRLCVQMCSGEAIQASSFDRERCVYCGACTWNCPYDNLRLEAGAGGLHSAEN
jgi:electron-transferring-flavoprotein dehydrogenase